METIINKLKLGYNKSCYMLIESDHNLNILPVEIVKYINSYIRGYLDDHTIRIVVRNWFDYLKCKGNEYCEMKYKKTIFRYGKVEDWDTSKVTDMRGLFAQFPHFSDVISGWDVSSVKVMSYMFGGSKFNQDIGIWNVSNVENMSSMFEDASEFNQDLTNWNVSNVQDMSCMFKHACAFNGNIRNWNVSSVKNMSEMFRYATSFSRDISYWDVRSVLDMSYMFYCAHNFDWNIKDWNVEHVECMKSMFSLHSLQKYPHEQKFTMADFSCMIVNDQSVINEFFGEHHGGPIRRNKRFLPPVPKPKPNPCV